jgi:hypothetical protein
MNRRLHFNISLFRAVPAPKSSWVHESMFDFGCGSCTLHFTFQEKSAVEEGARLIYMSSPALILPSFSDSTAKV